MARELTSVDRGDVGLTEAVSVAPGADIRGRVIRMPVDSLQPNAVNGLLYRESLREELLGALAESLRDDGQREPITVDTANVILDGERRWRALRIIGAQFADVIVDATPRTRDEVEDYVLHCYSLKRRASLYERVTIFEALVRSYTRRRGRPRGRPKKSDRNVADYWSPKRVRETAAQEAGLGSRETARRAQFVIRFGGDDIRARLEAETLSIDAAYRLLAEPAPKEVPPEVVEQTDAVAQDRAEPSVEGGQPRSSVRSEPRGTRGSASDREGQDFSCPRARACASQAKPVMRSQAGKCPKTACSSSMPPGSKLPTLRLAISLAQAIHQPPWIRMSSTSGSTSAPSSWTTSCSRPAGRSK